MSGKGHLSENLGSPARAGSDSRERGGFRAIRCGPWIPSYRDPGLSLGWRIHCDLCLIWLGACLASRFDGYLIAVALMLFTWAMPRPLPPVSEGLAKIDATPKEGQHAN